MPCNMEPRDVTHFLLVLSCFFCFALTQRPFLTGVSWCRGFVTLFLFFLQLSEYSSCASRASFPLSLPLREHSHPAVLAQSELWSQSELTPRLSAPKLFPNAASAVISWVTLSNISNSLLNYLICRMNIIVAILKTYSICQVLWYSVWHMYNVK